MELKIDLLKAREGKSPSKIFFGTFFFLIGLLRIIILNEYTRQKDWIFFGLYTFLAMIYIIEGLGYYSFARLFGKAYILINSEIISLKANVFNKKQSVNWDKIKSIQYISNTIKIEKNDNTSFAINLDKFNYDTWSESKYCTFKDELIKTINCIAKEKNIQFISEQNASS